MKMFENRTKLAALAAVPLLALAFAVAVGVFTHEAAATPPSGGGSAGNSGNEFAVGGFTLVTGDHVSFAAHQNPQQPDTYSGYVVQDTTAGSRSGPVFCLYVNGNEARVVWTVKHSDFGDPANQIRSFDVTDNGEPVMNMMSPDSYTDLGPCGKITPNCSCGTTNGGGMPDIIHGNIVVKGP